MKSQIRFSLFRILLFIALGMRENCQLIGGAEVGARVRARPRADVDAIHYTHAAEQKYLIGIQ